MADRLHSFFQFSKKERRALIILMALVAAMNLLGFSIRRYVVKNHKIDVSGLFSDTISSDGFKLSENRRIVQAQWDMKVAYSPSVFEAFKRRPFHFDPNRLSEEEWVDIGIHPRAARNIAKYLSKGGRLYRASDLKKIHGMDSLQADFLSGYLLISNKSESETNRNQRPMRMLDINLADSAEWESLKGIGPVLAGRIIKYGKKLGGFVSKEQLREVYGFNDSLWLLVKNNLNLTSVEPRKIPVNEADFKTLSDHPYIGYPLARLILAYRRQHGLINDSSDILKMHLLDTEKWKRLQPYLSF
jgi:DNA uptake protein ComE-like DNA-binding protein